MYSITNTSLAICLLGGYNIIGSIGEDYIG